MVAIVLVVVRSPRMVVVALVPAAAVVVVGRGGGVKGYALPYIPAESSVYRKTNYIQLDKWIN